MASRGDREFGLDDVSALHGVRGRHHFSLSANVQLWPHRRGVAGMPRLVVSKILNHVEAGVTAVYDRHSYDQEKRAALDFWGKRVEAIIANKRDAKVLTFRPRM